MDSIPTACRGAAVTGPTENGVTSVRSAATTASRIPRSVAATSNASAAGALVNVTASRDLAEIASRIRTDPLRVHGRRPQIGRDGDHRGTGGTQPVELFLVDEPVQLNGHRATDRALVDHLIHQRRGGLLRAHPGIGQPARAQRAARLRTANQDPGVRQHVHQRRPEPGRVGGLEPAAHAVGGGRQQHVRPGRR